MFNREIIDKLNTIYNYFGRYNQYEKMYEECTEYKDAFIFKEVPLKGEIADVLIVAIQHYLNDPEVREQFDYKLTRTLQRINNGYYQNMRTVWNTESGRETPQV